MFRAALVGNVGLGTVLAAAFAGVQLTTGAVLPGVGPVPTVLAAATIVLLALGSVVLGALQGERRFDAVAAVRVVETLVKAVLVVGAIGFAAFGLGGVAVALLASAAASAGWAIWSLRDKWPGRGPIAGAGAFAAAVPMSIATTGFGVLGTLDVLLLGSIGSGAGVTAATVGVYQAAAIIGRAPFFAGSALSDAVFPHIAGAPTRAAAHRATMVALRWVPLAFVPLQLVLLVAPETVLRIVLPGAYADAAWPIRLMTIGIIGLIVADMLLKALLARDFAPAVAAHVPLAVAVQVIGLVVLVPRYGAVGAALAFVVGTWATAALLGAVYVARFRPGRLRPATAARWVAAVSALAAVLLLVDRVELPIALLLVLMGLGGYTWLVVRFGLVPPDVAVAVRRFVSGAVKAAA
jgi:O-antigen/teichoic acid export membrane protein